MPALQPVTQFQLCPNSLQQLTAAFQGVMQAMFPQLLTMALPAAMEALQLTAPCAQVNINASSRSNVHLQQINVPPPDDEAAGRALAMCRPCSRMIFEHIRRQTYLKDSNGVLYSDNTCFQ
jgi:hypothetical protein